MVHAASRILIIDDSSAAAKLLNDILKENYELAFASDGVQGLALASSFKPDLILLDVVMPGLSGFDVCERLRADPVLADVPVILLTSLDDRESRLRGIKSGADDLLTKPFDVAEMVLRIRTITRLNRFRRLHAERERFELAVREADDGYLLLNDADEILYANPKARLLLGLPTDAAERIEGRFLALAGRLYNREPENAWEGWPASLSAGQTPPRYLVRPETPQARSCWLNVNLLQPETKGESTLLRLRDVTEQLGNRCDTWAFQSMVSHKLRTPMSGILMPAELLSESAASMSSEDIAQMAALALDSARRLNSEIEDILEYLEAPGISDAGQGFKLADLPGLAGNIGDQLGLEPVRILGLEPFARRRSNLPARSMELILWNLLENSKKFHPLQAPEVTIELGQVKENRLSLKMIDNGRTLTPDQLTKVWSPYYQGEKDVTYEVAGMGLGLSMVATLVWNVGGSCRLANREGAPGVVVELLLPLLDRADVAAGYYEDVV